MTPRPAGRTQACGRPQATARLAHARKFLDAAELIATDTDSERRLLDLKDAAHYGVMHVSATELRTGPDRPVALPSGGQVSFEITGPNDEASVIGPRAT